MQYTHARICRVGERFSERGWTWDRNNGLAALDRLDTEYDQDMMVAIARFPEVVEIAAKNPRAASRRDLPDRTRVGVLHLVRATSYILVEDADLRDARFAGRRGEDRRRELV